VELGGQNYEQSALMGGKPTVFIAVNATPTGNPLTIVQDVKALLPRIERSLPPGLSLEVNFDVAKFITASIDEVIKTLLEAIGIVVLVIFVFLGSLRAVFIPIVTIPLSLIGAGMRSHPGITAKFFAALAHAGVNIEMISTSEIRITTIIAEDALETALRALHAAFELERPEAIEAAAAG
jgi:Cu/Ag efflux pump CusA